MTNTNEIKSFLDENGRLKQYPARLKLKIFVLIYLAEKFCHEKKYAEIEINEILKQWHTFGDHALLRRDLCDMGFLCRERDGSNYCLAKNQPTGDWLKK